MYNKKILEKRGKELSFLLRHDPDYHFDKNGWREVDDLIENHGYSFDLIEEIVNSNDKKRYEFSFDRTKIRARQGHSIQVDVELKESTPPDVLYHGTATRFVNSILQTGINKGSRLHVHLSKSKEIAYNVGIRHGSPAIFEIDCRRMISDGIKFYLSNNDVWLTDYVDSKYIKLLKN